MPRERGMVTAEAAMVFPVLVCLTLALAWTVLLGVAQVRVVDAAREAARLAARGEDGATVDAAVNRLTPGAARWSASDGAGLVVLQVSTRVQPQVPLIGGLAGVRRGGRRGRDSVNTTRRHCERGAATVFGLGLVAVLLVATAVAVVVTQVVVARHGAAAAADLGALAGAGAARSGHEPCAAVARAVSAGGAELVECRVEGLDVVVTAAARTRTVLGLWWRPKSSARAGPA